MMCDCLLSIADADADADAGADADADADADDLMVIVFAQGNVGEGG